VSTDRRTLADEALAYARALNNWQLAVACENLNDRYRYEGNQSKRGDAVYTPEQRKAILAEAARRLRFTDVYDANQIEERKR